MYNVVLLQSNGTAVLAHFDNEEHFERCKREGLEGRVVKPDVTEKEAADLLDELNRATTPDPVCAP